MVRTEKGACSDWEFPVTNPSEGSRYRVLSKIFS